MGNILGLDYGARRVGVAIADDRVRQAFPRTVLTVTSLSDALARLRTLVESEDVSKIVIGRPLNLAGAATAQTAEVDVFVDALKKQHPSVPIETEDERYSTRSAANALREKGNLGKQPLDAIAAMLILETYLQRTYD